MPQALAEQERLIQVLLGNLRDQRAWLESVWASVNTKGDYENPVYRFYHGSWQAFPVQRRPERVAAVLRSVPPEGREFNGAETNGRRLEEVGPIVAAFFHGRFLLEMAMKAAADPAPDDRFIGYPWATTLSLFDLR